MRRPRRQPDLARVADLTTLPDRDARSTTGGVEVPVPRSSAWDLDDAGDTRDLVGATVELGTPAVRIVDVTDLDAPDRV